MWKNTGLKGMLRTMDQAGVRLVIFCGHEDLFAPSLKNACNIERVRRHPDRFQAYFAVNPNHSELPRVPSSPTTDIDPTGSSPRRRTGTPSTGTGMPP